ncbi:hypothetical protein [Streptomyces noursei]|uniref:hypothetical protein n=1 Tax=Streptomyces noursei TaxID=1971 RepID=UPI0019A31914|nr:hypothetical protein [Streptomyces noursei]MCZ1013613.1 hypothetical protein [Streptomyces noursei]GGX25424.1 hypothetical protein GCM10010341_53350 [Streptomyces noursei]
MEPGLLVLDGPWSGLDADAHGVLAESMTEVAGAGGTVIFTDHRESVTRARASRTYAIAEGRVTLSEPEAGAPAHRLSVDVTFTVPESGPAPRDLAWEGLPGVPAVGRAATSVTVHVEREATDALLFTALRHGWSVMRVLGRSVPNHDLSEAATKGSAR